MHIANRHKRRSGQVMVEFVLMSAFFWVPLIGLLMAVGFRINRSVELVELVNDVSQMYARGTDFTVASNQTLLTGTLAADFGMQGNGANTVTGGSSGSMAIVLSEYFYVNSADPSCNSCTNRNNTVLEQRIVIGNKTLIATQGTPASVGTIPGTDLNTTTGTCEKADNNLPPATTCQYTDANVKVSSAAFNTIMTNLPTNGGGNVGGTVYFVEVYFKDFTGRIMYQRSID